MNKINSRMIRICPELRKLIKPGDQFCPCKDKKYYAITREIKDTRVEFSHQRKSMIIDFAIRKDDGSFVQIDPKEIPENAFNFTLIKREAAN